MDRGLVAVVCVLVCGAAITSCKERTAERKAPQDWVLPSGRRVQPLAILRSEPDVDPQFLLLAYRTSLDITDTLALRDEAVEVWPRFVPLVERAGLWKAGLQVNAKPWTIPLPIPTFMFRGQRRFTFVVYRDPDATWHMLGDDDDVLSASNQGPSPAPAPR